MPPKLLTSITTLKLNRDEERGRPIDKITQRRFGALGVLDLGWFIDRLILSVRIRLLKFGISYTKIVRFLPPLIGC